MAVLVVASAAVTIWVAGEVVGFEIALVPTLVLSVGATLILALLTRKR